LELRDSRNNVSGCLIVEIRESDPVQAGRAAVSAARRDVAERGIATSNPIQDAVDDAVGLAASTKDVAGPVTISIKQIVEKTKVIADFIDEAAKVSISTRRCASSILILTTIAASPVCLCRMASHLFGVSRVLSLS
jgi:hypothetical protein